MAQVKLILLADVDNLGLAGEEVHVAPGYARNYLLPRGLAAQATPATLRLLAARKEKIEAQRKGELEAAQALAVKLAEMELTILAQASHDGQLFGSVTARSISDRLGEHGCKVEARLIRIEEPIRKLGDYTIHARLHTGFARPLRVVDERLSTASATRKLAASGRTSRSRRAIIDQAAAVDILEQALEYEKRTGRPAGREWPQGG